MKLKIASRNWSDDDGVSHRFDYYLLTEPVETDHLCCETYGVYIEDDTRHSACIPSITTNATRIDQLMTLLVTHLVGPAGLEDVLSDWL